MNCHHVGVLFYGCGGDVNCHHVGVLFYEHDDITVGLMSVVSHCAVFVISQLSLQLIISPAIHLIMVGHGLIIERDCLRPWYLRSSNLYCGCGLNLAISNFGGANTV